MQHDAEMKEANGMGSIAADVRTWQLEAKNMATKNRQQLKSVEEGKKTCLNSQISGLFEFSDFEFSKFPKIGEFEQRPRTFLNFFFV